MLANFKLESHLSHREIWIDSKSETKLGVAIAGIGLAMPTFELRLKTVVFTELATSQYFVYTDVVLLLLQQAEDVQLWNNAGMLFPSTEVASLRPKFWNSKERVLFTELLLTTSLR
jgi:hypothetical protein